MVEAMDTAVGEVLKTIDDLGLEENTIVVFTSDNGGVSAGDGKATSNLPLRGGKGRQWEGGIREPFYIKWPGSQSQGKICDTPVIGNDFFPTLLELAGLPVMPDQHLDGTSLVPLLKGEDIKPRNLYWHYPHYGNQGGEPSSIIRQRNWKYIYYYEDRRSELYDLTSDPAEQSNIVSVYPELAAELKDQLDNWLTNVGATFPYTNPNYDAIEQAKAKVKIREIDLPKLEADHAALLEEDWSPPKGWWENTGYRR